MGNTDLFFWILNFSHRYTSVDLIMIFGAEIVIYLTLLLIIYLAFRDSIKEKKSFFMFLIAILITSILVKIIHLFIFEPRPFATFPFQPLVLYNQGPSFPSVHSAIMATIAFSFFWYRSKWSYFLLFLMLWVGFARIYIGVHYPLDIIAGFLVGLAAVYLAHKLKKWLKSRLVIN